MKTLLKLKLIGSGLSIMLICMLLMSCGSSLQYSSNSCPEEFGITYNDLVKYQAFTYTVGDSGIIYRYQGGSSCTKLLIASGTTENLNAIAEIPSNPFIIVGNGGVIIREFAPVSSPTTENLNDVKYYGDSVLIADGDNGTIIKSTDNGLSWYIVSSGTTSKLNTTSGTEGNLRSAGSNGIQNLIYAAGEDGVLLRSTDVGETWQPAKFTGGGQKGDPVINSLYFVDSEFGWAACDGGRIFKTTSSGFSWNEQFTDFEADLNDVIFNTYSHGYAVGDNGNVLFTTTGGDFWSEHPAFDTLTTNSIQSFLQIDSVTYVAVGENGTFIEVVTEEVLGPLSNTYTVGPSGDFADIGTAVGACNYLGISDDIIFEIQTGVYNEQISLPKIFGSAQDKTITFRSQSGNASDVNLTFESLSFSENFTLLLDGAENTKFENITVTASGQDYATAVDFREINSNISFNNVVFNGIPTNSGLLEHAVVQTGIFSYPQMTNVTFQNCTFNNGSYGLRLSGGDFFQSNFDIEILNCSFLDCQFGISLVFSQLCRINDNSIRAAENGISLESCSNFNIDKNEIVAPVLCIELSSCVSADFNPSHVANNFLFSRNTGIRLAFENSYNNIFYNSINIFNPGDTASSPSSAGIESVTLSGDNNRIVNNIFDNKRRGYALNMTSALQSYGLPVSELDYNNYFTNGDNLANWNSVDCADLDALKSASGMNENSASVPVTFTDSSDLHLTGSSIGDTNLIATPIAGISDDIDDELRDALYPYMGADETALALPVELISFSANVNLRDVTLNWTTLLEQNNYGFNIERSEINIEASHDWEEIGFVTGNGNSNSPRQYSVTDRELNSGSYKYRLKQIDFNGSFTYHNLANNVIIGIPLKFYLSQNYPNPFNPATKINFDLPNDAKVELNIFDISGKEVAVILNEFRKAGYYTESFNAANLSSGIYFYRIRAGEFVQSRRMVFVK